MVYFSGSKMFIFQITLQHNVPFFKRLKMRDLYRTREFSQSRVEIQQSSRRSNVDSSKVWLLQIELRTYRARPDLSPKAQSKVRVFLKTHTFLEHPRLTQIFKEKKPNNKMLKAKIISKMLKDNFEKFEPTVSTNTIEYHLQQKDGGSFFVCILQYTTGFFF